MVFSNSHPNPHIISSSLEHVLNYTVETHCMLAINKWQCSSFLLKVWPLVSPGSLLDSLASSRPTELNSALRLSPGNLYAQLSLRIIDLKSPKIGKQNKMLADLFILSKPSLCFPHIRLSIHILS